MRSYTMLVLLLLSFVMLPGGGIAQEETTRIGPETYPEQVNPLTGLVVEDAEMFNRRPMLIKISNFPPVVRPQSGLNQADIVWEHLLAGGVTRFSALFWSNPVEQVGPIRSARLVDLELAHMYRALFVYSGMAQGTIDAMNRNGQISAQAIGGSGPCPALCRIPEEGLALEHTLYGDVSALYTESVARGRATAPQPIYGMAFSEEVPDDGVPLDAITVHYAETDVEWMYDTALGRWLRGQDGEPHFEALSESQVNAANVLIFEDDHVIQPFVSDQYWGPPNFAFSVNFIGRGRVYLLRDGRYYAGYWERPTRDDPLTYFDLNGNVLPFKPGNTFVNLVPRWIDGYSLSFDLADAPQVTLNGEIGISLRLGPGENYRTPDVAYPGDTFDALGRDGDAEWVHVRGLGGDVYWLPAYSLETNGLDLMTLPDVRPTVEG